MKPTQAPEDGNLSLPVVIHPIPWKNAPADDFSTEEFNQLLEDCKRYMDHFAMHTPHYFIKHKTSPHSPDQDDGEVLSAAHVRERALTTKKKRQAALLSSQRRMASKEQTQGGKRKEQEGLTFNHPSI